uniref:Uncharacterized protein LOC105650471 n=1 Tax=Rhizophora mucronata TaxID=61149 RepID=A0A2P2JBE7_RHIMU
MLFRAGFRHDAGMQLGELIPTTPDHDDDGSLFVSKGSVKNPLDPGLAVLERSLEGLWGRPGSYPDFFNYVAGLEHVGGPLVGFGTAFDTVDG